jgi:hypothetical protein
MSSEEAEPMFHRRRKEGTGDLYGIKRQSSVSTPLLRIILTPISKAKPWKKSWKSKNVS